MLMYSKIQTKVHVSVFMELSKVNNILIAYTVKPKSIETTPSTNKLNMVFQYR